MKAREESSWPNCPRNSFFEILCDLFLYTVSVGGTAAKVFAEENIKPATTNKKKQNG